jgi:hypothetical protein
VILSLTLLLSTVISLQEFSAEWTLEVIATVPESYNLQSLSINILHGSVRTEGDVGMSINNLRVDLCNGAENSVTLDGLKMSQVASICAAGSIKMANAQLSDGLSMEVVSLVGSAIVSSRVSYHFCRPELILENCILMRPITELVQRFVQRLIEHRFGNCIRLHIPFYDHKVRSTACWLVWFTTTLRLCPREWRGNTCLGGCID